MFCVPGVEMCVCAAESIVCQSIMPEYNHITCSSQHYWADENVLKVYNSSRSVNIVSLNVFRYHFNRFAC